MKWNLIIGSLALCASLSTPSFGGGLLDRMLGLKGSGCDSACCDTGCSADPTCGCEISACGDGCAVDPSCGCETACAAEPSCGCETACAADPTCGCEMSSCGCGAAPTCGCEIASCDPCGCDSGCSKPRRRPLLELLGKIEAKKKAMFGCGKKKGCDTGCAADPTCGCEIACADPTCGCEISACGCGEAPTCGCEISACDPCGGCDSGCGSTKKKSCGLLSKLFKKKSTSCDAGCDSACGCASAPACSSCTSGSTYAPVAAPAMSGDAAPMPPAPIVDPSAYLQSNRRVVQATSYAR